MTRTFRAALAAGVGLLLLVGAAPAQATPEFEAGAYPAKVEGASSLVVIGTEGGQVKCPISFTGTMSAASSSLDLLPFISFFNCSGWGFTGVTVSNIECSMPFNPTEKLSETVYWATLDFCPGTGNSLTIAAGPCAMKIEDQIGLEGIELVNQAAPQRVTAEFEVAELEYTVTKDNFLCPLSGLGAKTGGTITSAPFALKAVNPSKTSEELGLAVSGE